MKEIKTVKAYLKLMRYLEEFVSPVYLKGFDKLSEENQKFLREIDASISNIINEIEE